MNKKHFESLNVCALFSLVLFLITGRMLFVYIAAGFLAVSVFIQPLGRLIATGWLKLATAIGTFNSKVILSLFFFVILTPLALLRRLFTRDPIDKSFEDRDTYWKTVDRDFESESMEKTW